MIGFPILYWGALHDESSLHSKSTPIKKGLFIPLWDLLWMLARNKYFHPLSLFTGNTVAFAGISTMLQCVFVYFYLHVSVCTVELLFVSGPRIRIVSAHSCMCVFACAATLARVCVCVCPLSCHSVFTV